MINRGYLIVLEGIDGSGKTTLAAALTEYLKSQHIDTILTKEPGASDLGKFLRTIVQEKKFGIRPEAEFLLFAADRAQHFQDLVIPALKQKKIVVSDRMSDSSLAYQGYGRGLDKTIIQNINKWVMQEYEPDLVIYLRISPEIAFERIVTTRGSLSAFESEKDFIERVYHGFETIFANKKNCIIINAEQSLQEVLPQTIKAVTTWINQQQQ